MSRRRFLALGGALLASGLLGAGRDPARGTADALRIGVVMPRRTGRTFLQADSQEVAADVARRGAVLAGERLDRPELLGRRLVLLHGDAPDAESAGRVAARLAAVEEVHALVGGFGEAQAAALAAVADERRVPFFNVGTADDRLRMGGDHVFHVEPSDTMYLRGLVRAFGGTGPGRWHVVHVASERGEALARTATEVLAGFPNAQVATSFALRPERPDFQALLETAVREESDVLLLLLPWLPQLDFLERLEATGRTPRLAPYPDPVSQTRAFLARVRDVAPRSGAGRRVASWDPMLDAPGVAALTDRFHGRWGAPMDPSAWAAYHAIKIVVEAVRRTGDVDPRTWRAYLRRREASFDVAKGEQASFRAGDGQLRQSVVVVRVDPSADDLANLARPAALLDPFDEP